ncbi:hypothetical protein GCM10009860_23320 [Microbacterium mitrae]|uniref:VanZ family protein n=1 Tax=Microbacterium mitrae TaxID=664640 RepID=A0A5C8HMU3_9MICO|nr:VanZ family protein [Microbacterium mitrae]TXK03992.1 VanZ family protein [Microbacterium mitrae]
MNNQVYSAIMAILLGAVVCIVVFVPFVAVSYRRRGTLTFGRIVLWAAAAVYGLAIWTYTLLPLPESDGYACAPINLDPSTVVDDVRDALATGNPLTSVFLLQLVFNVLLFVPLGFFLRVLAGRGIVVAGLVGLGISLIIEFTQVTGAWGLYPCAYRIFDVVDMMTNTSGALIGSIIALMVPRHLRATDLSAEAAEPRPVTRWRRLLAMLCDALGFWLVAVGVTVTIALGYSVLTGITDIGEWPATVGAAAAVALWSIFTLATGQSVGDYSVMLRYVEPRVPVVVARILRPMGGIVGWYLIGLVPLIGGQLAPAFALATFILIFFTPDSRGLPGFISTQRLVDAREPR